MKTAVQTINGMLDLLDGPEKWIRHVSAKDGNGYEVNPHHPEAVSWCLAGALAVVFDFKETMLSRPSWAQDVIDFLGKRAAFDSEREGIMPLPVYNDEVCRDYEDMRMFLKRALLEAEELNI